MFDFLIIWLRQLVWPNRMKAFKELRHERLFYKTRAQDLERRLYRIMRDRDEYRNIASRLNRVLVNGGHELQFSKKEIQQLLMLCHPDKHDNKPSSIALTQKLIEMKRNSV